MSKAPDNTPVFRHAAIYVPSIFPKLLENRQAYPKDFKRCFHC